MPTRKISVKAASSRSRSVLPVVLALSGLFLALNAWLVSQQVAGL